MKVSSNLHGCWSLIWRFPVLAGNDKFLQYRIIHKPVSIFSQVWPYRSVCQIRAPPDLVTHLIQLILGSVRMNPHWSRKRSQCRPMLFLAILFVQVCDCHSLLLVIIRKSFKRFIVFQCCFLNWSADTLVESYELINFKTKQKQTSTLNQSNTTCQSEFMIPEHFIS